MLFEHTHCYFFRKPPKIASTFGKQQSFLDILFSSPNPIQILDKMNGSRETIANDLKVTCSDHFKTQGITPISHPEKVIEALKTTFNDSQEYGLLNRLDNETSGLLYFAKNIETYSNWKKHQKDKLIKKYYLAKLSASLTPKTLTVPLAHHKNGKKMIVVTEELLSSKRKQKISSKILYPQTTLGKKTNGYTQIMINTGCRHQIRIHVAHEGAPIVGDQLYGDFDEKDRLELYSIGCTLG